MTTSNQERYDASRKAAFIEKFSDEYDRSPNFKFMVDNTVYITDAERQESMALTGTDLVKGKY